MKKLLILTVAVVFYSFSVVAQTIVLDWNQYAAGTPNYAYQTKISNKLEATYQAKKGDLITIHIAGTSDYDLSKLNVVLVDDQPPAYWKELSAWGTLGATTAGTAFDYTATISVSTDAGGAGGTYQKLCFDSESAARGGGAGTSVSLTLTTFEVTVATGSCPAGNICVSLLPAATAGDVQATIEDVLATTTNVKVGDKVRITMAGTSNVPIDQLQALIVDGTAAASYWLELSAYTMIEEVVTAGTAFSKTVDVDITAAPLGTGAKSQNIVLLGKATSTAKLTLTSFTATIVPGAVSISETATNNSGILKSTIAENVLFLNGAVENALIFNTQGSLVKSVSNVNSINVADLTSGMYMIQTSNGSAKFIVK